MDAFDQRISPKTIWKRISTIPSKNTLNGLLPTKNLNLQLPKDGIEEKMIPHTDLILPRPWDPMVRKDLGSRVWVRGEEEKRA